MKFYEFNESGYYALIGATTEEVAIEYYGATVSDIEEEDGAPTEVTKAEAKEKLIKACSSNEEKAELVEEFNRCTTTTELYLILIDGSLI